MWVKGSGGDLGTLTAAGLAVLRLDRLRALVDVYPGVEREDEMVAAFDFCLHGKGGAAPSIDTAMHGLVEAAARRPPAPRLRHRDRDRRRRRGADPADLRRPGGVGAVAAARLPARPGHRRDQGGQPGGDRRASSAATASPPGARPATSARPTPWRSSAPPSRTSPSTAGPSRSARWCTSRCRRPSGTRAPPRCSRWSAGWPRPTGRRSATTPTAPEVLDFVARAEHPRLAALGTSCPDHFLRTKVAPAGPRPAARTRPLDDVTRAAARAARGVPRGVRAPTTSGTPRRTRPPMRGADPAIVLVPGVGMFTFGKDKQTARVAGEFYVNAINVMRGAEALSTYAPIPESEKFRIEYWELEEAKLRRMPKPQAARHPRRVRHRRRLGHRRGHRAPARRRGRLRGRRRPGRRGGREGRRRAGRRGAPPTSRSRSPSTSPPRSRSPRRCGGPCWPSAASTWSSTTPACPCPEPLLETTAADWDLQHDVMARGSFLVSREAARVMIEQGMGGDIVYISSKNAVFAGPNNVAYGAAKADQAHQVRLLAAELGGHGIRVNGINPDGVVRGSGIFAGGWGAQRAAVYGVRGGEARRVLRPADAAQARGAARARRRRRLRPHRRRPDPHHRAAHPRRRGRRRRLPPLNRHVAAGRRTATRRPVATSGPARHGTNPGKGVAAAFLR